ncbi:MAG: FIST C-terminal domain-containing protein [Treponema sp.]|nr:FIST C-terminal domain-containing protein [Treponema sp.]
MNQEVVQSRRSDTEQAVNELCSQLKKNTAQYNAIIFFASSSYDFPRLSALLHGRFPSAQVVGTTTSGEISEKGFAKGTIVLNALSDGMGGGRTQFKGVLIDDANLFPMVRKKEILSAAASIGVQLSSPSCSRDAFAISLICGLLSAEEGVLSLLYSLVKDEKFLVAGGSAGDDLNFKATSVSLNGVCSNKGAVILFVKTTCPFRIYKENIFQRSGKTVMLTNVNPETHAVLEIDRQNPRRRYASVLNIPESQVADATLDHPFGRVFGDEIYIASLVQFDNAGKLTMYARVLQDSVQEILEPMDTLAITEETCKKARAEIPNPGCVILFNCILRTVGFEKKRQQDSVNAVWKRNFPVYSGFSTYGEQFGHINSNQTLVMLVIGE